MKKRDEKGAWVRVPIEERFWEYVDKSVGPEGCWLWTGSLSNVGYGRITDFWQKYSAHRLSYEWAKGPIPPGKSVCHSCDVRACVNPAHLWLGSHRENMEDMVSKGRAGGHQNAGREGLRGGANGHATLTDRQVLEIRAKFVRRPHGRPKKGEVWDGTLRGLAAEFGVSKSLVSAIVNRKVWTHI